MLKIAAIMLIELFLSAANFQGSGKYPIILIKTELGDITVELYSDKAPVTVSNFLRYIDSSLFDRSCFYRVVKSDNQPNNAIKIAVIQGGRWKNEDKGFPAIEHETTERTGILHKKGVISMARSVPGSATSEFFICVGDQPELDFGGRRNKDGQGFAAFGRVIKGYEIVEQIHNIYAPDQYLSKPVVINKISKISK
jgi:peptidyl-prolyl cis-trans isomerase A (cyclophilin A)